MNVRYPRSARVAERIHTELADMLLREVKDPRVRNVAITKVEVTPDLRKATVYFSRYGEERGGEAEIDEGLEGLERASGFLQRMVASRLQIRRAPRLEFRVDLTLHHEERIGRLFHDLHDEKTTGKES